LFNVFAGLIASCPRLDPRIKPDYFICIRMNVYG
jgi:hypothetical protein